MQLCTHTYTQSMFLGFWGFVQSMFLFWGFLFLFKKKNNNIFFFYNMFLFLFWGFVQSMFFWGFFVQSRFLGFFHVFRFLGVNHSKNHYFWFRGPQSGYFQRYLELKNFDENKILSPILSPMYRGK